jgi:phospholipid transport system substrate-binding protein
MGAALCLAIAPLFAAMAAPPTSASRPDEVVQHTLRTLQEAFAQRQSTTMPGIPQVAVLVDQIVSPNLDTPLIGRLILGSHWREANEGQRFQISDAHQRLLVMLISMLANASQDSNQRIAFLPVSRDDSQGRYATVRMAVHASDNSTMMIDCRMRFNGGQWKLYDLAADGVSFIGPMRASFDAAATRKGMDEAISMLLQKQSGLLRLVAR